METEKNKQEKARLFVASKLHDPGAGVFACLSIFVPSEASRVSAIAD